MNGSVDAASARELAIGSVDDRVHLLPRDVAKDELNRATVDIETYGQSSSPPRSIRPIASFFSLGDDFLHLATSAEIKDEPD